MKKTVLLLLTGFAWAGHTANAQDFKLAKSSGTLEIKEVNHLTIEGNNGSEIIFSASKEDRDDDKDKRSQGLRAISTMGYEDNTGVGLSAVTKGDVVEVHQMKKMDGPDVKISVPKGVTVYYEHTSPYGDDVTIRNVEGKLEISTVHNGVHLENVTGPVEIKTVHGEVEASFPATMKNPVHIASIHGAVDVTLPTGFKANLQAKTNFGEILVDPDFKVEMDRGAGGLIKVSDGVTGKINGGGIELDLSSQHDNVYIRKK